MEEFGDFEGAALVEATGGECATATGTLPPVPVAPVVIMPQQNGVCNEPDRDSIVSNPGVEPVPVKAPGGGVIFEGPIHVMRPKGGMNSRKINKTVRGMHRQTQ